MEPINFDYLLTLSREELIEVCSTDPKAVKICGTPEFVRAYNNKNPLKSMVGGRNEDTIYPMHDLDYYGKKTAKLGSGTFGTVFKIENPDKSYALKTFVPKDPEDGVKSDVMKEAAILRRVDHPNILKLIDIINFDPSDKNSKIQLLLNLAEGDLSMFVKTKRTEVTNASIQSWIYQLARGLTYLHDNDIVHRDLKHHNVLVFDNAQLVKIADFGISRAGFIPGGSYTGQIQTALWRAPEILLSNNMSSIQYGPGIDVFSLGIMFAELFLGNYVLNMKTDKDILMKQISLLGHMTEAEWPGISNMKGYTYEMKSFADLRREGKWEAELKDVRDDKQQIFVSDQAISLIKKMTYPNPSLRITAREVANDAYFDKVSAVVDKMFPFVDNGPYICGTNMDSALLVPNYIPSGDITENMLKILMDWLVEVATSYNLQPETIFHARLLVDYYLSKSGAVKSGDLYSLNRNTLQCIGCACLLISSNLFEIYPPSTADMGYISDNTYKLDNIVHAEKTILKVLEFDLLFPSIGEFLYFSLKGREDLKPIAICFAKSACILVRHLDPRLIAYAIAYISYVCSVDHDLPKCFYDGVLTLDEIIKAADNLIKLTKDDWSKYIEKNIHRWYRKEIKAIIGDYEKCKSMPKSAKKPIKEEDEFKKSRSPIEPKNDKGGSTKTYKIIYKVSFDNLSSSTSRNEIGTFMKRYIQSEARKYVYKPEGSSKKDGFDDYFGLKAGSRSLSKITVKFGEIQKEMDIIVEYNDAPDNAKFRQFVEDYADYDIFSTDDTDIEGFIEESKVV